ncbi:MAG TPA: hypothetical protein VKM55_24370 [Candidatus Lokiarchaeia archaeon]|nr:hypothetical protein [Candidatus Lokiarchaeia archaeon]
MFEKRLEIVCDGDNIARYPNLSGSIGNLHAASWFFHDNRDWLNGIIIVGPNLRRSIDNLYDFDDMLRRGWIKQTPPHHSTDEFVLEYAARHPNAYVLSNDLYRDYKDTRLEIAPERVIQFLILDREIIISGLQELKEVLSIA